MEQLDQAKKEQFEKEAKQFQSENTPQQEPDLQKVMKTEVLNI